jgi:hypothetical protein
MNGPATLPSEIQDALKQGAEWWNQFAIRFRAGNAKWTADQKKDLDLLAASMNALFVAFRRLLKAPSLDLDPDA